jgi:transmembrane sensor
MPENKYHKIEDFLMDNSFVEWALGNSATEDDYWKDFLLQHPACEDIFKQACDIIQSFHIKSVNDLTEKDIDLIISHVNTRIAGRVTTPYVIPIKSKRNNLLRFAAFLIIAVTVGLVAVHVSKKQAGDKINLQTSSRVINKSGAPMLVKLPDNSSVILQPGAQINYSNTFSGNKREVSLQGEALFEVSKNPAKPFYVYSGELTIRVVGTSFMVKANDSEGQYKVSVSTGRVEVSAHSVKVTESKNKSSIVLSANQQVVLYRKDLRLEKAVLKKPMLLSKESTSIHFNFSATPFSKVVTTIEEAYGVHITYDEKVMDNCQLTASLSDQSLDERLKLICKAVEAEYKIVGGQITITGNGCDNQLILNN